MEKSASQFTSQLMAERFKVGYALADGDLVIVRSNAVLRQWKAAAVAGRPLTEALPELLGMETELRQLAASEDESLQIPRVYHPSEEDELGTYFDLQIESFSGEAARLLVTVTDVTEQTRQAQSLQQQRNELHLLTERLNTMNAQLDYLLKRFVPEKVAQQLIDEGRLPDPGGERRCQVTVLFADMRNFTAFAESVEPETAVDVLNIYFTVINEAIWRHEGSVVQIVGDMLMAAFNVMDDQPDHPMRAMRAALDARNSLTRFVALERPEDVPELGFGIGVSTGLVTVGYLGSQNRYRYAVVGDTTNVAFHLCSMAAENQIILSQTTMDVVRDRVSVKPLGDVTLKRRKRPLAIYELLSTI